MESFIERPKVPVLRMWAALLALVFLAAMWVAISLLITEFIMFGSLAPGAAALTNSVGAFLCMVLWISFLITVIIRHKRWMDEWVWAKEKERLNINYFPLAPWIDGGIHATYTRNEKRMFWTVGAAVVMLTIASIALSIVFPGETEPATTRGSIVALIFLAFMLLVGSIMVRVWRAYLRAEEQAKQKWLNKNT